MSLAQGPQRSDAGEAQTRCSSVSCQALYHWATALPRLIVMFLLSTQKHSTTEPLRSQHKIVNIFYPFDLTYVLGAQKNHLNVMVLLSTQNICFG